MIRTFTCCFVGILLFACGTSGNVNDLPDDAATLDLPADAPPLDLRVEPIDQSATTTLFGNDPRFEVLISGLGWAEGPLVLPDGSVIVSDVKNNRVMRWDDGEVSVGIPRSGGVDDDYSSEPGSNGLWLHPDGDLLLCRHGSRDVLKTAHRPDRDPSVYKDSMVVANQYQGKRLSSPNDLVVAPDNSILFTDPPYGLPGRADSPERELDFSGVYRAVEGQPLQLLTDRFERPNGIAISHDGKTLYVANSDRKQLGISAFPVLDDDFNLGEPTLLLDAAHLVGKEQGSTDGMVIARNGRLLATAPGGVWVLEPDGRVLAKVRTGLKVANVTLDPSEDWLYLASDYYLIRIKINP